ncbi:hypothetical protein BV20DRAFT_968582 [Pilatotrama ljubarskyi]|nr:hypothetical protein BV20DRAFT_968582 [Pilatotrama ljubarskyi]
MNRPQGTHPIHNPRFDDVQVKGSIPNFEPLLVVLCAAGAYVDASAWLFEPPKRSKPDVPLHEIVAARLKAEPTSYHIPLRTAFLACVQRENWAHLLPSGSFRRGLRAGSSEARGQRQSRHPAVPAAARTRASVGAVDVQKPSLRRDPSLASGRDEFSLCVRRSQTWYSHSFCERERFPLERAGRTA